MLIQVATNLANDYCDFVRGTDTSERVGPVRVTQAGLLSPSAVARGMLTVMGAAVAVGLYLVVVGGWPILVVGVVSLLLAVAYSGGPYPLAYHGLGDVFVFVFFGLVAVAGTYWVQARSLVPDVFLAGAGVGALSTAILVVNNLRDWETDARAGKRTLAVRLGRVGSVAEYTLLVAVGVLTPGIGIVALGWPLVTGVAGLAAAVAVARPLSAVWRHRSPHELLAALGQTARGVALYGGLLAATLVWGGG